MDGIKLFKEHCEKYKISFDEIFYSGIGKRIAERCSFDFRNNAVSRPISQKYIIKYWTDNDIFVVWKVNHLNKTVYSISPSQTIEIKGVRDNQMLPIIKAIEYQGRGEETVYAFKHTMISAFIEQVLLKSH